MGMESDDKVKFAFIAYLITALDRRRKQYIHKLEKINATEMLLSSFEDNLDPNLFKLIIDFDDYLPVDQQIEDPKVFSSLKKLRGDENTVFLWRIMTDCTFKEIAGILGINENTAKGLYYSALAKIRKRLLEDD